MLITTPEELRLYLPTHTLRNIDTVKGFLHNSQESFLRERVGKPMLLALESKYMIMANGEDPIDYTVEYEDTEDTALATPAQWRQLIGLCQRIIVYDAFERAAALRLVSENDMGLNVAESDNYDSADDKRIDLYRKQLNRERHEAVNMLLVQLEEWQLSGEAKDIIELWRQSTTYYFADGMLIPTATEMQKYLDIYESREKFISMLPDIRYCQEVHIEAEIGERLLSSLIDAHRTGALTDIGQRAYVKLQRTLSLYTEARSPLFSRREASDESIGHMRLTLSFLRSNQVNLLAPVPSTSSSTPSGVLTPSDTTPSSSTPSGVLTPSDATPSVDGDASPSLPTPIQIIATSPIFNPYLWPIEDLLTLTPDIILSLSCDMRRAIEQHAHVHIAVDGSFITDGSTDVAIQSNHRDACCHDPHDPYPYMVHPPHCHHGHNHHAHHPDHRPEDDHNTSFLTTSLI